MKVGLHDQVGALGQRPGQAVRQLGWSRSDSPAAELARTPLVAEVQGMMHHFTRAGTDVDGCYPLVLGEMEWQDEIAVDVRPIGGHVEGPVHGDDQVRLAEIPALWELRYLGEFLGIALGHAVFYPALEQGNLPVAQAALVAKVAVARLRLPRRHVAALDHIENGSAALLDVAIAHQFEGSRLPRTMTAGAVVEDDRGNVF